MNPLIQSLAAENAPRHLLAALGLLQFRNPSVDRLRCLSEFERTQFFRFCDDRQLTLMLPHVCPSLAPWASETVRAKANRYNVRFERLKRELFEIVAAFEHANLEFVMLKGLSHAPALTPAANLRGQGDIDLWLLGSSVHAAREVLRTLGYRPTQAAKSRHLPPMARPTTWKWRGDLYDPEMPISVELHYELWSHRTEFVRVPGTQQFWERKIPRKFDGHTINVLCNEDLVAFAALHLLLHLLHGELPLQRAWEIAHFLDIHANDNGFWRSWSSVQPAALRQLEISIFCLIGAWFGCNWPKHLNPEVQMLPQVVVSWLDRFSLAPLRREWKPNKSELWLHLALVKNRWHKVRVLVGRLIPLRLPVFVDRGTPAPSRGPRLLAALRQTPTLLSRFLRHMTTFLPTLLEGLRWLSVRKS